MADRPPVSAEELIEMIAQRFRDIDANDESWSGIYGRGARLIESEFAGRYPGLCLVRDDEATVELVADVLATELEGVPWADLPRAYRDADRQLARTILARLTVAQGGEDG